MLTVKSKFKKYLAACKECCYVSDAEFRFCSNCRGTRLTPMPAAELF